jgi:protein phosphatase PTC1
VFGSKKERDSDSDSPHSRPSTDNENNAPASPGGGISVKTNDLSVGAETPGRKQAEDSATSPNTETKKRRSSSAKAKEIFTQAKNSLIHGDKDGPQTPMQKLSKTDAALSVPQGSLNNSAGESQPTPNSSFLVGVTEDKNKKCRRTMEDTHSYLYNFLGTPAPVLSDNALSQKKSQEDRSSLSTVLSEPGHHVVETDNGYFAIFDGHAGTFAAEWCGKKLHVILEELMRKYPNTPVPELLDQTYTTADNQLERLPLKNSGCTAITAVLRWEDRVPTSHSATGSQAIAALAAAAAKEAEKNEKAKDSKDAKDTKDANDSTPRSNSAAEATAAAIQEAKQKATRQRVLYTANVGDARIVLCRNGKALRLSYDHKGLDENEGRRITKAGGLILNNRVNGVLAVTRALGDSYLKDLVTGHPYTTETVIQPDQDEFLILACDGVSCSKMRMKLRTDMMQLWDVCSDQEAVDLIRNVRDPQQASKMLVDYALARFSTDNLSVMIVRFDPDKLQENAKLGIGVESDVDDNKGAISEVEMIVGEARRHSTAVAEGAMSDQDSEELKQSILKETEQEQEPGPELTPEGQGEAEKILSEKQENPSKSEDS